MSRELRILHLADSHIGADLPGRPRSKGRRRGDDLIDSYRHVLGHAKSLDVDLVIHAGDVFDRPNPNTAALTAASEPLLDVAAAGIPVVITPGNHERSVLPDFLLFSHANIHIVREPTTLRFDLRGRSVAVATFPCIRRQSAHLFEETLAATEWAAAKAELNILAVHQTFESATCGPGNYRFRAGDDVIERDLVPREFDYVAAGHIHRHQTLETPLGGTPIVYAGSPDRISFAEREEPKGFELIECNGHGLTHRFVEHEVRPMQLIPLCVTGCTRGEILESIFERIRELPEGAMAALRLSGETTRRSMSGLKLAQRLRAERPDVRLNISVQAIEYVPERQAARSAKARTHSAFADLDADSSEVTAVAAEDRKLLPAECGTYAFFDAAGRVLYVGKANNVRTRVRSHLSHKGGAKGFAGWTRQIARVEARRAYSELEALLVEAELIRTLRPAYNRQMRHWSRYCFLCEDGREFGQLSVCVDAVEDRRCFGPFRGKGGARMVLEAAALLFGLADCPEEDGIAATRRNGRPGAMCRRYFEGACTGPCGGRVNAGEYRERRERRDLLLAGVDDSILAAMERYWEKRTDGEELSESDRRISVALQTLRAAYEYAATVRLASGMLNCWIEAPGVDDEQRTLIQIAPRGLRLRSASRAESARRATVDLEAAAADGAGRLVDKSVVDCLCTAYREAKRGPEAYRFAAGDGQRRSNNVTK